jgi:formate dehydrogenase subunit delta
VRQIREVAAKYRDKPEEKAAAAIAAHIRMFFDPNMQEQLRKGLAAGEIRDPVIERAISSF